MIIVAKSDKVEVLHPNGDASKGYLSIRIGGKRYIRIDCERASDLADGLNAMLREYRNAQVLK